MFPSFRTFWITVITLVLGAILLSGYLYFSCMANPACSGESGIVIVMLGLPWVMYPFFGSFGFLGSVGISIMINIILLSFCVQCLGWLYTFFSKQGTSSHTK